MKLKNVILKSALMFGTVCLTLMAFICPIASIPVQASEATIQPRQDILEYLYKVENGKLYKRLYNSSTGNWVGDWIYVCDYPG